MVPAVILACQGSAAAFASPLVVITGPSGESRTEVTRWAYSACSPGGTKRTIMPGTTAETGTWRVTKSAPGP